MSHIAILGATGRAGGRLLDEALRRGHTVTTIARHASAKLAGHTRLPTFSMNRSARPSRSSSCNA